MDTLCALILVYTAMSIPLGVTLMMTYFRTVPVELKEAARIDGAGEWTTFTMVLPLVRPGLAAVATVTMLPIWNDLWFPLILAPSKANQTVTLGVQQFVGQFLNDYPALLAALTLGARAAGHPLHHLLAPVHPRPERGLRQMRALVAALRHPDVIPAAGIHLSQR